MRAVFLILALSIVACDPPKATTPGVVIDSDGGVIAPPSAPEVSAYPAITPYVVQTLRGRASGAKRVVAFGTANPTAVSVLPDGNFCLDIPLLESGDYDLMLVSLNEQGQMSETNTAVRFTYDPDAPDLEGLSTCTGADPAGCGSTVEDCSNGRDDDCDGRVDGDDLDCAACRDDALEQNDSIDAPSIDPVRIENLQICPGDDDYYRVYLRAGETIHASIFFETDDGDLDMRLLKPDGSRIFEGDPDAGGTEIGVSQTTDDQEMITYQAPMTGRYIVWVYGYVGEGGADTVMNTYSMDIEVRE